MDANPAIREFILANTNLATLGDEDDLFAQGGVGSMFVMQLVLFLEKRFGIAVTSEDLSFDQFRCVAAMADLVARKKANDRAGGP